MNRIRSIQAVLLAAALSLSFGFPLHAADFYQTAATKKGILVNSEAELPQLVDLNVSQVILNFPLSYAYNEAHFAANEHFLQSLKSRGISITLIVLNDWGASVANPALLPVSSPAAGANYYAFNTLNEEGLRATREAASRIVNRLGSYVSSWVIGNEINDGQAWNYIGAMDIDSYAAHYAKAYRCWYDTIKGVNSLARVYIPFDFRWNHGAVNGSKYTVKELLPRLNALLRDTDYGIAWHAYPENFEDPVFTDDRLCTDDANTPYINLKNLSVLTSYLESTELRTLSGAVRSLSLTEQGFTSVSPAQGGERQDLQLQMIQEAYRIAAADPHVEAFMLNRLQDDAGLVAQSYAFGLLDLNGNPKAAYSMYRDIDS
ncbi:hypothetical protein HW273_05375 [Oribacterium sp. oral taxon 102]|uniref:DUF5722 domain-containing protein n=1 Tax=Oribacterium sp. oral taxon 102 TaxID=671214 RepID=UPI0015B918BE|nr:DUF5722 domain-containing protein [Oribacterium sp. oral taxon 102]NWO21326.1 hypothetical protein [Oribacterium sp. oral taxon 102]